MKFSIIIALIASASAISLQQQDDQLVKAIKFADAHNAAVIKDKVDAKAAALAKKEEIATNWDAAMTKLNAEKAATDAAIKDAQDKADVEEAAYKKRAKAA